MAEDLLALDFTKLHDEDANFVRRVLSNYPAFQDHAHMKRDGSQFIPFITVASPADSSVTLEFWSDAQGGPSYGFAGWHGHLEDLTTLSTEANYSELWKIVDAILDGRSVVLRREGDRGFSYQLVEAKRMGLPLAENERCFAWSSDG